tara:strand:+ start:1014 stop:1502 length:489 start_codon:yes stop_codon:yes gene_type:complete
MPKRSLNQISSDIMLVQNSFELTEQEIDEQLDILHTELHEKENGVYWFYRNLDSKIDLAKEYKEKADAVIKKLKYTQEKLKKLVLEAYSASSQLPSHDEFNPIKIIEMGKVEIIDESKIPDEYYIEKIETRLDKRRILEELKEGVEIPGVTLRKNKHVRGLK